MRTARQLILAKMLPLPCIYSEADDTLAAIAAMIAARNSCMRSWRQGVPDTLAAMTTAVSGSDYAFSCYLDTVREQRHCAPSPSNR